MNIALRACCPIGYQWKSSACPQKPDDWNEGAHPYGVSFGCEHGEYNDLATALLSRPPETIRRMFSLTNEASATLRLLAPAVYKSCCSKAHDQHS